MKLRGFLGWLLAVFLAFKTKIFRRKPKVFYGHKAVVRICNPDGTFTTLGEFKDISFVHPTHNADMPVYVLGKCEPFEYVEQAPVTIPVTGFRIVEPSATEEVVPATFVPFGEDEG